MIQYYLTKIVKDTGWVLILNSINYASTFIIALLVSRFMGIEQLGIYTFTVAVSSLIYLISDFGLTTLLVRRIGEYKSNVFRLISNVNVIKITLATACTGIFFAIGILFNIQNTGPALWLGIAASFPRLIQTTYEGSIRVFGMQRYPTIIRSVNSLLQIVFSLYAILLGYGLLGVFIVILILELITAVVFAHTNGTILFRNNIFPAKINKFPYDEMKNLFKKSSVFFIFSFLRFSSPAINIFLLEYIRSTAAVGIYSAGVRFVSGIGLFSGAVYSSFYPFISNLTSEVKIKYELTHKLLVYATLFGVFIISLIFIFSDILIDFTFKIEESKMILKILSFTVLPVIIFPVLQSYFFSSYYETFLLRIFITTWLLNLLLTFVLVNFYSYKGLALSTLIIEYILLLFLIIKFNLIKKTIA